MKFSSSSVNVAKSAGTADLVTFTEEILKGKLHFLCSEKNDLFLGKLGIEKEKGNIFSLIFHRKR